MSKKIENIYAGFPEGLQLFENRMRCLPEAAFGALSDGLAWLDMQIEGKEFICTGLPLPT